MLPGAHVATTTEAEGAISVGLGGVPCFIFVECLRATREGSCATIARQRFRPVKMTQAFKRESLRIFVFLFGRADLRNRFAKVLQKERFADDEIHTLKGVP